MNSHFYRAFEDRHRGPRTLIKSRLRVYFPFIEPLRNLHGNTNAVDLGCGRGEWLELMQELGVEAHGIDLDEGMLSACRELDLSVETNDAVSYLKTLSDGSLSIVSAFHVVEHVPFEQLQALAAEAHRVLKPGGILLMETPNPENVVVATRNFYLDPTHQRPIPPELLSFVAEFYGFARVKIVRLQEADGLTSKENLTLQDVLGGASPDYAVVAQKTAEADVLAQLEAPFSKEYGLSLEMLTARYELQVCARVQQAQAMAEQAEARAQLADNKVQDAQVMARQAEARAQQAQAVAHQAEAQALQAQQLLRAVGNSLSWRLTAPLRWCGSQVNQLRSKGAVSGARAVVYRLSLPVVRQCIAFVDARPTLKNGIAEAAHRVGLYGLLDFIHRRFSEPKSASAFGTGLNTFANRTVKFAQLTPRARVVYLEIKSAIEKNRKVI